MAGILNQCKLFARLILNNSVCKMEILADKFLITLLYPFSFIAGEWIYVGIFP